MMMYNIEAWWNPFCYAKHLISWDHSSLQAAMAQRILATDTNNEKKVKKKAKKKKGKKKSSSSSSSTDAAPSEEPLDDATLALQLGLKPKELKLKSVLRYEDLSADPRLKKETICELNV